MQHEFCRQTVRRYWLLLLGFLPFCVLSVMYGAYQLNALKAAKDELNVMTTEDDIDWTKGTVH